MPRVRGLGENEKVSAVNRPPLLGGPDSCRAAEFLPLSMLCFIEELLPEQMPIPAEEREAVAGELEILHEKPVLDALLLCLQRLAG